MNITIRIATFILLLVTITLFNELLELVVQGYDYLDTLYIGISSGMLYVFILNMVSEKLNEEDKQ